MEPNTTKIAPEIHLSKATPPKKQCTSIAITLIVDDRFSP
jgi:hypothetical protein